ncbi:molybdopterin-dependent oxidoreductase [Thermodesulfobacterium hveragerdense]|uniref:molybdopterin-dependent oxidoreductase n=1 Tax=Thermodesulfobacterium hveragerdense TaxID=53424 RepID=UPI0004199AA2|nr:molybdopterin-dependent oxidoreductase [Thermodesulfobacterium hveragerdense]
MKKQVFSVCGMCSARCPIRVEVTDGRITWIEGNPYAAGIEGALCARGSAGLVHLYDFERPQGPMVRVGERGSGEWKRVSWEEALNYIANRLSEIIGKYGPKSVALLDRGGGLFGEMQRVFIKAIGSPNYFNHDDLCRKDADLALQSLIGIQRNQISYDFANARHIVSFGRAFFDAVVVKEANNVLKALEKGAKLTYFDPRVNVTATKATRYFKIRPGTDYAVVLALIHQILKEDLYDRDFVNNYMTGITDLEDFIKPYTPKWAEAESGVPEYQIIKLARELAEAKPRVIIYPYWFGARYTDSFYYARAVWILNFLLGNLEQKGGLILAKSPKEVGAQPLKSLLDPIPAPQDKRIEAELGKGFLYDGAGHILHLYKAIKTEEPYPIKALFVYRYDPFAGIPLEDIKEITRKLELLVHIPVDYGTTGWFADVILPESTYLERDDIVGLQRGAKPAFILRRKAIDPVYDTKPRWWIFTQLCKKLGLEKYVPYESIEDIWNYQLEGTGVKIEDFEAKGFVSLCKEQVLYSRDQLKFKTPSGKIEIVSSKMQEREVPDFYPYKTPEKPRVEEGEFRLIFGRAAMHTHVRTQNNPLLNEIKPENELWINDEVAGRLRIKDGDWVEVSSGDYTGKIKAKVTPFIHPEAVFMVRGYQNDIPWLSRVYGKGLNEGRLLKGAFDKFALGSHTGVLFETFVTVKKA